jgi:hypothetical protein
VLRGIYLAVLLVRKRNGGTGLLEANRAPRAPDHAEPTAEASIRDHDADRCVLECVDSAHMLGDEAVSAAFVARVACARCLGAAKACGFNMLGPRAVFATVAESPEDEL